MHVFDECMYYRTLHQDGRCSGSLLEEGSASSSLYMFSAICHTCIILSSDTLQITHESLGFHAKSEIFDVCPPCMKRSSGGPSSASSGVCSSPILLKSHTCRRRSVPLDAKIVSLCGDHCTWKISSLCDSKE